jgi:carbon monoxide dehydrogenase subunit G
LKISGSYQLPVDQERAYHALQDPALLAKCMPGCDRLDKIAEDTYEMKMKMVMASVSGLFEGRVRIADQHPPDSFKLIVEGAGKIGFMKGEGNLKLVPNGSVTDVNFEGDVHVGGTIAAVGQRLIDSTSKLLIKKFFEKITAELQSGAQSATT